MTFTRCVPTAPALSTELGVRIDQRPVTTTGRFVFLPPVTATLFRMPIFSHPSRRGVSIFRSGWVAIEWSWTQFSRFFSGSKTWGFSTPSRQPPPKKPGCPGDSAVNHNLRCLLRIPVVNQRHSGYTSPFACGRNATVFGTFSGRAGPRKLVILADWGRFLAMNGPIPACR